MVTQLQVAFLNVRNKFCNINHKIAKIEITASVHLNAEASEAKIAKIEITASVHLNAEASEAKITNAVGVVCKTTSISQG